MPIGTGTNKSFLRTAFSKKLKKIDVIRDAKSSHKSMVDIFIETDMFIV